MQLCPLSGPWEDMVIELLSNPYHLHFAKFHYNGACYMVIHLPSGQNITSKLCLK